MATNNNDSTQRGFTLMEVLIALAIFAVCAATMLKHSGQALRQAQGLETRTFANWIAENRLEALRLEPSILSPGKNSEIHEFANRRWQVNTQVFTTRAPTLYRIVVLVSEDSGNDPAVYSLDGFIGIH